MELQKTDRLIERGIDASLHIGAQLYVSRAGKTLVDRVWGEARLGVPMRSDTILPWMSATKPIVAVAIAQLWERGKLKLDDFVANYIPAFGIKGKERITIRHLLTHTGGFRGLIANTVTGDWEAKIEEVCALPLERRWVLGRTAGYHSASSWFMLGELIRRIDGRDCSRYLREEIMMPLGMWDSFVGMPAAAFNAYGMRIGTMMVTEESPCRPLGFFDTSEGAELCRPGGGGMGPARELGAFYRMLLNKGVSTRGDARLLSEQTVEAITARHRVGEEDKTFRHKLDWGLGFVCNSSHYRQPALPYGFGRHASPRCYGHGGRQSSMALADPEFDLTIVLIFNGMPGEEAHQARAEAVLSAIYEDLGLGE